MSNANNNQVLSMTLDEITSEEMETRTVLDDSGNNYDGTAHGSLRLVYDDTFGSCMSFEQEGDYISLPDMQVDFSQGLTIETWAHYSSFGYESRILDFMSDSREYGIVFANDEEKGDLVLEILSGGRTSNIKSEGVLSAGRWMHLAATVDATGRATLYVDGKAAKQGTQLTLPPPITLGRNYVGKTNSEGAYFRGKMASLRVYDRALTADEIIRDMDVDRTAAASFLVSYPISFRLFDENDQHALYITDNPQGLPLNVELQNTSRYAIQLARATTSAASANNHHFQLNFRPGTLLDPANIGLEEPGWDLKVESTQGKDSLYLLCAGGRDLASGEKIELKLRHVRANGNDGAHGTRVELKYRQLNYKGDAVALTGNRVQHLSVVNHSGQIDIPLHASFKGSQLVFNDGISSSELTLLIYNTSTENSIPLNPGASEAPSKFIISFDAQGEGEEMDWALGAVDEVAQIDISASGWTTEEALQGESPEWSLVPQTKTSLDPGGVVEVTISNIVSSLPSGLTNLYLRYENIPGYWDGQLIRTLQKSPIRYVEDGNGVRIGVGVAAPRTALDLGAGVMSGAANDYLKAQFSLTGGGTVTWGGPGQRLKWTNRFIAISMERSKTFSDGYIEIVQPTTDIPAIYVYDRQARSVNAGGVQLNDWESLYAVHEIGGNRSAVSFRIVNYKLLNSSQTPSFFAPSNWILVAAVNNDDKTVRLGTGAIVNKNSSISKGNGVPCGTIMMWYGNVDAIPDGWALCNGQNGTPNLVNKFTVAAGDLYNPGATGGQNNVALTVAQLPAHSHGASIGAAGAHAHNGALDTGSGGSGPSGVYMPKGSASQRNQSYTTDSVGDHSHTVTIGNTGEGLPFDNRPAYYAICFIMKLF